MANH
ncbi:hypothetical protein D046_5052A, partial [Vibrio parahaemolyticus V-223/04]|jgi:hypothetical protein